MNSLASYIDHTLLKADATESQIRRLCQEALTYSFFSVCVNSIYVPLCDQILRGSEVKVCSVVGFPLGAMGPEAKAFEAAWAVAHGASEIDMVLAIGALKDRRLDFVREDIRGVVQAAQGRTVKVILETSLLTQEEKLLACQLSQQARAHFVKTATGFGGGGATLEDIQLMKKSVGDTMAIKASGGIRDTAMAWDLIKAGASRLGTSSGVSLIADQAAPGGY